MPFVTGWMGENHFAPLPTAVYGVVLLMAGIAYYILKTAIISAEGPGCALEVAVGQRLQGQDLGRPLSRRDPARVRESTGFPTAIYAGVALMWLVPDRRIEKHVQL